MKQSIKHLIIAGVAAVAVTSCAKKLDLYPQNDLTPETVYSTYDGYISVLAKVYGGLATTGNAGPAGASDIQGLDEGSQSPFIRGFFNCQELPTDEAVVAWNDQTIKDFHNLSWSSADPFLLGMYARPIYNITVANEYLRESTTEKVDSRGITGAEAEEIKSSRAEVRFLRAFNYWVMMDIFGKSTFITEDNKIGTDLPGEISREDLFVYIRGELLDISNDADDNDLAPAKTIEYGRVDKAAAWALLARLYLNAETYINEAKYDSARIFAEKVIGSGYLLHGNYQELFMADNDKRKDEFIFAINCDGLKTQSYGNTTFFCHAAAGDNANDYGVNGGWYGYRTTSAFADLFEDKTGLTDTRALFSNLNNPTINDISNFNDGIHVRKYINIRSDGAPTNDVTRNFTDVDYPVFRLPEMYLIYAEAFFRGGGGDQNTALAYLNELRQRAYKEYYEDLGKISLDDINDPEAALQLVLDERGRELYWEGHRRTDLIRYGLLTTGTYLWPWKGGVQSGTAVDDKYNIFPIPATNLTSNTNLTQNDGY